ncbi:unnamed protein product, partial [marine sediment metagenome]
TSVTDWTIEDVPFTGGPFLDENITATDMTYASTGAGQHTRATTDYYFPIDDTGTLTASVATFLGTAKDVGTLWLIKHTRADNKDTWTAASDKWTLSEHATVSAEIPVKGDFSLDASGFVDTMSVKIERKVGNGDWQDYRTFSAAIAFSSTEDEDDVYYRVTVTNPDADKTGISFTARN